MLDQCSILVADATYQMAEIKKSALRAAGVRSVRLAAGLVPSLEWLKRETFDFILLDENVTAGGFASFIARIRDQSPGRNVHTPILVASSRLDEGLLRAARGAGVALVLRKPFSGNDIRSKITQLLGRQSHLMSSGNAGEAVLL